MKLSEKLEVVLWLSLPIALVLSAIYQIEAPLWILYSLLAMTCLIEGLRVINKVLRAALQAQERSHD